MIERIPDDSPMRKTYLKELIKRRANSARSEEKTSARLAKKVSDTLVELREQGQSIPSEFKCSNCQHYYHPTTLTLNAARMLLDQNFDPNYDATTDYSPIVCPGSESWHLDNDHGVTANLFYRCIGSVDFDTDTIKVMLCTSKYVPSPNHIYKSHITNEVVGKGYTAGGAFLTSATVRYLPHNNSIEFDAADTCWHCADIRARHAIVYQAVPPYYTICHINFGHDHVSTGGSFNIAWDRAGFFTAPLT